MKKVVVGLLLILFCLSGCQTSEKYPSGINADGQKNEHRINYKKVLKNIENENYDQAFSQIEKLKQRYSNDYMLTRLSTQLSSYLKAEHSYRYERDWEAALKELKSVMGNGSSELAKHAKELSDQIDINKITFDGHSTERERMYQAGAAEDKILKISDQEINKVQKLSLKKGAPEPHKGEYLFIETIAEEHPELNMSIKTYENYWGKE